jgi:hypothetical protein
MGEFHAQIFRVPRVLAFQCFFHPLFPHMLYTYACSCGAHALFFVWTAGLKAVRTCVCERALFCVPAGGKSPLLFVAGICQRGIESLFRTVARMFLRPVFFLVGNEGMCADVISWHLIFIDYTMLIVCFFTFNALWRLCFIGSVWWFVQMGPNSDNVDWNERKVALNWNKMWAKGWIS